jgi:hypothetical protein
MNELSIPEDECGGRNRGAWIGLKGLFCGVFLVALGYLCTSSLTTAKNLIPNTRSQFCPIGLNEKQGCSSHLG